MKIEEVSKCNAGSDWSIIYWLLGLVLMPIALPLAAINYWQRWQARRFRKLLPGKVVLITGASSGLGEALAHVFYKAHCRVLLAARRVQELERVKRDLLALDVEPSAYVPTILQLDLSELNDIPAFVKQALSIHNHIDILINNGGISVRADALSSGVDVDLKVMLVNYFGSIALTKALLPSMLKRQQGQVCFISSVQGKFALPHRSAYSASKHAVQAFADSLRAEVGHKGINVCCVSPGYIKTQLSINALTASGAKYGKMDKTTAKGMSPEKLAMRIFNALMCRENEIVVCDAQAKVAHYLRYLFPSVYFWLMSKRAIKLERETAAVEAEKKDI